MRRIAFVTGIGKGIGRAVADKLSKDYTVVRHSKSESADVHFFGDLSDQFIVSNIFEKIEREFGPVSVLVCCAGGHGEPTSAKNSVLSILREEMDRNLFTAVNCTQRMLLNSLDFGRIVTLGSYVGCYGNNHAAYSTAKAALHEFTRCLGTELGKGPITANCVVPGNIATERVLASHPFDESFGLPEEIAEVVGFLCSPGASLINGQLIRADGGKHSFPL